MHALWALSGLGALDEATHRSTLYAGDARLRRNAVRALAEDQSAQTFFHGSGVVADRDAHTRLAALVKLAAFPPTPQIQTLVELTPIGDAVPLAGDEARGEAIFSKHPTAACILCHALKGQGSTVGPALDGLAARKDAAYIRQSLLEPNAVLAQGFEYLKVSPVPAMGLILSAQEIEDVQAFLQTLR